jgi:hypothetical protein
MRSGARGDCRTRFCPISPASDAPRIGRCHRFPPGHRENRLHSSLDASFSDHPRCARTKAAAHNLGVLKPITLNRIRPDPVKRKAGVKAYGLIAATSDLYRAGLAGPVWGNQGPQTWPSCDQARNQSVGAIEM